MQTSSPDPTLETLAKDFKDLEHQLAKNNAKLLKAVRIGIKLLETGAEVRSEDLKGALQEIADSICTRPPGCYPETADDGTS